MEYSYLSELSLQHLVLFLVVLLLLLLLGLVSSWRISPLMRYHKLKRHGFGGPTPSFPLGNIEDMKIKNVVFSRAAVGCPSVTHDIHSIVFPYFARWQKSHGKVFIYWLGTEPFLYIADPEFLKKMSGEVMAKRWGKPNVFKQDRDPMFGNGLVMVEGNEWIRHRHVLTPAFSPLNVKTMANMMMESANHMLDKWANRIQSGHKEIYVHNDITGVAENIISRLIFGMNDQDPRDVCEKLRALQRTLFESTRNVGVPFGKYMNLKKTLEAKRLGKEIDKILLSIIQTRMESNTNDRTKQTLLGLLLQQNEVDGSRMGKKLTTKELVDECKTFFFGGHETTSLALIWTLMLLAMHQDWQKELREEIRQEVGHKEININVLARLKKMGWVMNEVLRLYSPAPNVQRQAREDIRVGDVMIPNGTNIWIDVVAMHHDKSLWGEEVNEFRPERFKNDIHGGCNHKMGFMPFGFGGRMCIGRNLTFMEYKIMLTMILSRFKFTLSPSYSHSPRIMLSLRPAEGLPLLVEPLDQTQPAITVQPTCVSA